MTHDLVAHFPHEMCILHRVIIMIFSVPTGLLVAQNSCLIKPLWVVNPAMAAWSLVRVLLGTVRPYLWWHSLRILQQARMEPTPELVGHAFMRAQDHSVLVLNNRLGAGYLLWLVVTTAWILVKSYAMGLHLEDAELRMWAHCQLNFLSLVAQKLLSIVLFFYLIHSDKVMRGMHPMTLDNYSDLSVLTEADVAAVQALSAATDAGPGGTTNARASHALLQEECPVCYRIFAPGDTVRWLECPHAYHKECIDPWLLKHKNTCPLCQHQVGPRAEAVSRLRLHQD